jgi:hypothetical protein
VRHRRDLPVRRPVLQQLGHVALDGALRGQDHALAAGLPSRTTGTAVAVQLDDDGRAATAGEDRRCRVEPLGAARERREPAGTVARGQRDGVLDV